MLDHDTIQKVVDVLAQETMRVEVTWADPDTLMISFPDADVHLQTNRDGARATVDKFEHIKSVMMDPDDTIWNANVEKINNAIGKAIAS